MYVVDGVDRQEASLVGGASPTARSASLLIRPDHQVQEA
jgi:hypothetical protein